MIDVQEHFYDDDPTKGHPDVRTRLKDVSYFFLGNGFIQAAVQVAPGGEGTPVGLLIMNPEHLGKKRESLTFDSDSGLENTMIRVKSGTSVHTPKDKSVRAVWFLESPVPAARVQWKSRSVSATEHFYCPDMFQPILIREVRVKNIQKTKLRVRLQTGVRGRTIEQELPLDSEEEKTAFLCYALDRANNQVTVDFVSKCPTSEDVLSYWENVASVSFGISLLDHYFLTGDRRSLEVATRIGSKAAFRVTTDFDFGNCRSAGWPLILAVAMYNATYDKAYLNAAKIMVEKVLQRQTPDRGGWVRALRRDHCRNTPPHHGNAAFMVGVLLSGLKKYHRETQDERVAKSIIAASDYLINELWIPKNKCFRYTSCPDTRPSTDLNILILF